MDNTIDKSGFMYCGLKFDELSAAQNIFRQHKLAEVIIFGSRAKGNYKAGSDIDLAIKGHHLRLNDLLDLHNALDNLELAYKFDIINYEKIKDPDVVDHISRVGKRLYVMQQKQDPTSKRILSKTFIETPGSSTTQMMTYSAKEKILEVELKSGKVYQYFPVDDDGWIEFKTVVEQGESAGKYYNIIVKNKYDNYREVLP